MIPSFLNSTILRKSFGALLLSTSVITMANAQKIADPVKTNPNQVYTAVETPAEFNGGLKSFYSYLQKNVKYPTAAKQNNVSGKVFATFVVEKDGSLSDIKIMKGIGSGCDEEAVRVLKSSPKWKAGKQGGKIVRQQYTVPIMFGLVESPAMGKSNKPAPPSKGIVAAPDQAAEFPGGVKAFYAYAAKTIKYPEAAKKNNVQGKVFISFVVEEDGSLTDMQVMKGIGAGCDEEAIRALASGPKWIPGKQNGEPVSSHYTIPINFSIAK